MMMNGPLRCELTGELLPERQLVVMDHLRPVMLTDQAGPPITLGPTRSSIVQVARSLEQNESSPITSRRSMARRERSVHQRPSAPLKEIR